MKMNKTKYTLILLFFFASVGLQAQDDYDFNDLVVDHDTMRFVIQDDANNLIAGEFTPVVSKDSLLTIIRATDGIETRGGIDKRLYAKVARKFDKATISFVIKNGQKYVYQYNDGMEDVLKNGTGLSKLFNESLDAYTNRIFKDSILVSHYHLFRKDTLHVFSSPDEVTREVAEQIIEVFNDEPKLGQADSPHMDDAHCVIDEEGRFSYVIFTRLESNGKSTIKKVNVPRKNKHRIKGLPQRNFKRVIHIGIQ